MLQATYGIRYINAVRNWLKVADFFFCKITVWPASKDVSHIKDDFLTAEGYLFYFFCGYENNTFSHCCHTGAQVTVFPCDLEDRLPLFCSYLIILVSFPHYSYLSPQHTDEESGPYSI